MNAYTSASGIGAGEPVLHYVPADGDLDLPEATQPGQHVVGGTVDRADEEDEERGRVIVAGSVSASDAATNGREVLASVEVEVRVKGCQALEVMAAAHHEERRDRSGSAPVAIREWVDGNDFQRSGRGPRGLERAD